MGGVASLTWRLFAALVAVVLAVWLVHFSEPDDLADWPLSQLRTVAVTLNHETRPLPPELWKDVVSRMAALEIASDIGWRGERWTYLARLEFDCGDRGRFVLSLATRPSLGNRVVGHFRRAQFGGWWHYRYYKAESLLRWLQGLPLASPEA
jgi:hypothetical protein